MSLTETILELGAKTLGSIFGSANDRELKRLWPMVEVVNQAWEKIRGMTDEELREQTKRFRIRLINGETEEDLLPEAYATCREASHRTLGQGKMVIDPYSGKEIPLFAHFDVQILGGIVLHQGKICEMVTGEGKTLVATLPAYLNALRPTPEWIEFSRQHQGDDPEKWTYLPFGETIELSESAQDTLLNAQILVDGEVRPPEELIHDLSEPKWVVKPLSRLIPDPNSPINMPVRKIVPISRGIHVITVNDYLAARDAEYNRPLFEFLGLTVGAIQSEMDNDERIPIYSGDIVYGTNNEFGFDYLRDNLHVNLEDQVQRSRFFAIIDEVDSVLIDEARTPLIISGSNRQSNNKYLIADRLARRLKGEDNNSIEDKIAVLMKQGIQREDARIEAETGCDYVYSERDHSAKLTEGGTARVLTLLKEMGTGIDDIYSGENMDMPHYIDNALRAHSIYQRDHHYIVKDGQIYIVDEFTGRVLEGRRWSDGLHQAVEAKEGLKIKEESQTVASITFQNFFRLYSKLCGMTGTAMTEAKEFSSIYELGVVSIPTNRPLKRHNYPDLIYGTLEEKYKAMVRHVTEVHATGRPILLGTVSIARSELISEMLERYGVPHNVLNARQHAREAEIVAKAGQMGAVTVATNMAGRGTDIILGKFSHAELLEHWQKWSLAPKKGISADMSEAEIINLCRPLWVKHYLTSPFCGFTPEFSEDFADVSVEEWDKRLKAQWDAFGMEGPKWVTRVADLGGLHIVGSERHEARRIDNQLRGRSGRQGDPGSSRFFLSLEDDTMRMYAHEKIRPIMQRLGLKDGMPLESKMLSRQIEGAQRKVEERNYEVRKNLLEYDMVNNDQRKHVYSQRQEWLRNQGLKETVLEFCQTEIASWCDRLIDVRIPDWDLAPICANMRSYFDIIVKPEDIPQDSVADPVEDVIAYLYNLVVEAYDKREEILGTDICRMIEKHVLLQNIDRKWMDHLAAMDILRDTVHLWGYAGQDPKIRYKKEAFEMFKELIDGLQQSVATIIFKLRPAQQQEIRPRIRVDAAVHQDYSQQTQTHTASAGAGEPEKPKQIVNEVPKVGRNDPCPCGSGRKYKACCMKKLQQIEQSKEKVAK